MQNLQGSPGSKPSWQAASPEWIRGRILTLLHHYFTVDMDPAVARKVADDWVAILGRLPQQAIDAACHWYLEKNTRAKPVPGDIKELAVKWLAEQRQCRERALPAPEPVDTSQLEREFFHSSLGRDALEEGWHVSAQEWIRHHGRTPSSSEATKIRQGGMEVTRFLRRPAASASKAINSAAKVCAEGILAKRKALYAEYAPAHGLPEGEDWGAFSGENA